MAIDMLFGIFELFRINEIAYSHHDLTLVEKMTGRIDIGEMETRLKRFADGCGKPLVPAKVFFKIRCQDDLVDIGYLNGKAQGHHRTSRMAHHLFGSRAYQAFGPIAHAGSSHDDQVGLHLCDHLPYFLVRCSFQQPGVEFHAAIPGVIYQFVKALLTFFDKLQGKYLLHLIATGECGASIDGRTPQKSRGRLGNINHVYQRNFGLLRSRDLSSEIKCVAGLFRKVCRNDYFFHYLLIYMV